MFSSNKISGDIYTLGKETIIDVTKEVSYECEIGKIIVPVGFVSDGLSIPKLFWSIVGDPWDYLGAGVVHDYACREGQRLRDLGIKYIYTWQEVHEIFRLALVDLGCNKSKAQLFKNAVYSRWLVDKSVRW